MLTTLFASHGVPMLLAGDEMGQSQNGNNNAYCQDNEITWIDWEGARPEMVEAVASLIAFRREWRGHLAPEGFWPRPEATESVWWHPEGREMEDGDWQDEGLPVTGLQHTREGCPDLLIVANAGDDCEFTLPEGDWHKRIDSACTPVTCNEAASGKVTISGQAVTIFQNGEPSE